jgi:hypothetical protein
MNERMTLWVMGGIIGVVVATAFICNAIGLAAI